MSRVENWSLVRIWSARGAIALGLLLTSGRYLAAGGSDGYTKPTVLRVSVVNQTAANWALYVGQETGRFRQAGLDLQLTVAGSSAALTGALTSGAVDIGHMAAGNVIEASEAGSDLFMFMGLNRPVFSLVVAPAVSAFEQLRGTAIGVDNGRTGYVHLVRAMLRKAGLTDDDYRIDDVGGVDARYRALLAGRVQAALLSVPRDLQAVAVGYRVLAELDESPEVYSGSVAVARRSWAKAHHDDLVSYVRAYRSALAWLYDTGHEAEAARILAARLEIDESLARAIYRHSILERRWLVPDGTVHPSGLAAVTRQMGLMVDRGDETGWFDRYVDLRYVTAASTGR